MEFVIEVTFNNKEELSVQDLKKIISSLKKDVTKCYIAHDTNSRIKTEYLQDDDSEFSYLVSFVMDVPEEYPSSKELFDVFNTSITDISSVRVASLKYQNSNKEFSWINDGETTYRSGSTYTDPTYEFVGDDANYYIVDMEHLRSGDNVPEHLVGAKYSWHCNGNHHNKMSATTLEEAFEEFRNIYTNTLREHVAELREKLDVTMSKLRKFTKWRTE